MNSNIILRKFRLIFLNFANNEVKIKYLRKQGMKIGQNCFFATMSFSTEPYLIEIGNHVSIAGGTVLITHDGAIWCFRGELPDADIFGKIKIGNNVFIGSNCTILPNTVIGNNCIVGAGCVVRGVFPDNSVIVGNPAKVASNMSMQRFLFLQNPGLLQTKNLEASKKTQVIIEHFGIKD
jgi:acetyltransferase-like isoleucine patch superfamily enzyme